MFKKMLLVTAMSAVTLSAVQAQDKMLLDTDQEKYSYAVGYMMGQRLQQQFAEQNAGIDVTAMLAAFSDVLNHQELLMSEEEVQAALQAQQAKVEAEAGKAAAGNLDKGMKYLQDYAAKDGITSTASGMAYKIITAGSGDSPTEEDTVVVNYKGTLIDGTEFDSSYKRGQPATFPLGGIIPGWKEVLQMMKPGGKWEVVIPPQLAYGERGAGRSIGPNETLIFEIELLEIK